MPGRGPAGNRDAPDQHLARGRRRDALEAGDQVEHGRLAAAGRTQYGDELAAPREVLDREGEPGQRGEGPRRARGEGLLDASELDHRHRGLAHFASR